MNIEDLSGQLLKLNENTDLKEMKSQLKCYANQFQKDEEYKQLMEKEF